MNAAKNQFYLEGLFRQDRAVLKEIYQVFRPRIVAYVQKNGGSEADAEDLFQVALEVVFFKQYDENFVLHGSFYGFLQAVCKNKWLDELKKRKSVYSLDQVAETAEDYTESEEAQREWEQFQLFEEKFGELGDNCREVLESFYYKRLSHEAIAAKMGWTEKYSRISKHRCLERLKKLISEDIRFRNLKNSRKT